MVRRGEADALITGVVGRYRKKLQYVMDVIGKQPGANVIAAMGRLEYSGRRLFYLRYQRQFRPVRRGNR